MSTHTSTPEPVPSPVTELGTHTTAQHRRVRLNFPAGAPMVSPEHAVALRALVALMPEEESTLTHSAQATGTLLKHPRRQAA